ncbi:MAG: CapA family protein [Bacteroidota bacterium]
MKRTAFLIAILFTTIGSLSWGQTQTKEGQDTLSFSLMFIGDIMQHSTQISSAYNPVEDDYDYNSCFQYVKPVIESADYTIANLELTLAGKPYAGYPQFSAPDNLAVALKNAGIDFLVTANNHSLDRRKKGLERTIDFLDSMQIPHTGTFKTQVEKDSTYPYMLEEKGFKLAILNYTYGTNGIRVTTPNVVNMINKEQIGKDIELAKSKKPDAIIVVMHWGKEYVNLPNESQKSLAKFCFEKGANAIIGAHPHVLQPIEFSKYEDPTKNKLVAYSLGNYVSNQRTRGRDGGMMVELKLKKTPNDGKTWIDDAGYHLTWVYRTRDLLKDFYILPTSIHTNDTTLIKEKVDIDKMNLFIKDSRALLGKHNKNVGEYTYTPREIEEEKEEEVIAQEPEEEEEEIVSEPEVLSYKIQFFVSSKTLNPKKLPKKYRKDISSEKAGEVNKYLIGNFETSEKALAFLEEFKKDSDFKDAYIVIYKNGNRME